MAVRRVLVGVSHATALALLLAAVVPLAAGQGPLGGPSSEANRQALADFQRRIAEENEAIRIATERWHAEFDPLWEQNAGLRDAFDDTLDDYARTHRLPGTSNETMVNYTEDGRVENGEVWWIGRFGYIEYRAPFAADGTTTGLELTPNGRALRHLRTHIPPGPGLTYSFSHGRDSNGRSYISEVFAGDSRGVTRIHIKYNQRGEPYFGEFRGENRQRTGGFVHPDNEPREEPRKVLFVPGVLRPVTGVCEACREKAEAFNDAVGRMSTVRAEIQAVVDRYQVANGTARQPLEARHAVLLSQWQPLATEAQRRRAELAECLKTCAAVEQAAAIVAGSPAPGTGGAPAGAKPGTLAVPGVLRPITGVCPDCREKAEAYNAAAAVATKTRNQIQDLVDQHATASPEKRPAIEQAYAGLVGTWRAQADQAEQLRNAVDTCAKACAPSGSGAAVTTGTGATGATGGAGNAGLPKMPVPAVLRPITGVCPDCREKAEAYNEAAAAANDARNLIQNIVNQHATASPDKQAGFEREYAKVVADQWRPANERAAQLKSALDACTRKCQPDAAPVAAPTTGRVGGGTGRPADPPKAGRLPVPNLRRPSTGVCADCRQAAEAYNDAVRASTIARNAILRVADQYATAPEAQRPRLEAEHRRLWDEWQPLGDKADLLWTMLEDCTRTCDRPATVAPDAGLQESLGIVEVTLDPAPAGGLGVRTQIDWYSFTVSDGSEVRIENNRVGTVDTEIWLYDADGDDVVDDDEFFGEDGEPCGTCSSLLPELVGAGTYFIRVEPADFASPDVDHLALDITTVPPPPGMPDQQALRLIAYRSRFYTVDSDASQFHFGPRVTGIAGPQGQVKESDSVITGEGFGCCGDPSPCEYANTRCLFTPGPAYDRLVNEAPEAGGCSFGSGGEPTTFYTCDGGTPEPVGSSPAVNWDALNGQFQSLITANLSTSVVPVGGENFFEAPRQSWLERFAVGLRDTIATVFARAPLPRATVARPIAVASLPEGTLVRLDRRPGGGQAGELLISVVATGASTGEVFKLQTAGGGDRPTTLRAPNGLVLQALKRGAGRPLAETAKGPIQESTMTGFCLDFLKPPPVAGTLYRVAPPDVQQALKPLRHLMDSAQQLFDQNLLHPDSNPASYLDFVKQWSIWSKRENWDLKTFGDQFIDRTKKNFEQLGRQWTGQIEDALRGAVPNRWRDIEAVMKQAEPLIAAEKGGN